MNLDPIWSAFLDFLAQIVIPTWNNLIQYLPLLLVLLLIVSIGMLAWYWQRNAAANRPRVPKPLPAGRPPDDLHMPGPSLWPFVAPVGLMLIAFAVVFGVIGSLANMALLGLGVIIVVIGLLGWYADANREFAHVAAGGHGTAVPALGSGGPEAPGWSLAPPAGMHLPGPSAWPFLAPLGLLFIVAGLIFGPALIVGGLVMAAIASIGWLFDAGRELKDVEEHGHPTQADRDPERAWPRRLLPVYVLVGGLALLITLAPWLISLLPGSA